MSTCNDCLHAEICPWDCDGVVCEHFKDRSKFIELPCEIGSEVFVSPDNGEHFHKATLYGCNGKGAFVVFVNDNELTEDEKHIVENPKKYVFYDWFSKVYSKEEAEKALVERGVDNG